MIFQFSDGEFSDPIATSLKMWKKNFLHAFFFSPPTRKLAARSLAYNFKLMRTPTIYGDWLIYHNR